MVSVYLVHYSNGAVENPRTINLGFNAERRSELGRPNTTIEWMVRCLLTVELNKIFPIVT